MIRSRPESGDIDAEDVDAEDVESDDVESEDVEVAAAVNTPPTYLTTVRSSSEPFGTDTLPSWSVMAERWVALLRGINVGGGRRLAMGDLRATMAAEGATDVVTYVQSGNIVFGHSIDDAAELASMLTSAIASRHGMTVPVVVRTGAEMQQVAAAHPDGGAIEPKFLHVVFFDRSVERSGSPPIDAARFEPDRFVVDRREAYLTYPGGSGRSKLTIDVFEQALGVTATARNMNSVRKIAALAAG